MERPVLRPIALLSGALLIGGLAAGAAADVLVLRDGSRIETEGKWETKGRQLVFKTASGTLATVRASEVDLAASQQATADAAAPKAEAAAARKAPEKRPVLVLTDKDVPKALPEASAEVGGAAGEARPPAGGGKVEVTRSSLENGQGEDVAFVVRGTLQNNSPLPVAEVAVLAVATVTRENDNRRVYCEVKLENPVLPPKGAGEFSCPIKRQDVLATGMAEAFGDAVLSFEVRSTPQVPAPDDKN